MTISEYREIRFSATALRAALQARLAEANGRAAPAQEPPLSGTVVAASITRADPLQITVEIASPEGAQRGQVVMEAVEVAAALMRACMQHGIRLPRDGAKSVKAMQGGVALVLSLTHAAGPTRPRVT
jgi:hypothetical protein